jgi:hypothetical protein
MIVGSGRDVRAKDAQASRHAEVQDERTLVESNQNVFGAPFDAADDLMRDRRLEMPVDGPAQSPIANHDMGDASADEGGRDAATGGLYFRQFGHGSSTARERLELVT